MFIYFKLGTNKNLIGSVHPITTINVAQIELYQLFK